MMDTNFESWFKTCFVPQSFELSGSHHRLLMYDGHNSHLTYDTVKCAMDNDITILCLPPNTSHALQPLDVGVFKTVKSTYARVCEEYFKSSRRVKAISKEQFPKVFKKVWDQLDEALPKAGFKAAGLLPFNPHAVDDQIILGAKAVRSGTPPPGSPTRAGRRPRNKRSVGRPRSSPRRGPRNNVKLLRQAICSVLDKSPAEGLSAKPRKITRVQCKAGEVLTTPEVAKRLLDEKITRENKKPTKKSKVSTSAQV
ncbi:unnamed protein product, partial [Meganyctiphanes norvegica]